jgi:hypothetical protein
MRNSNIEILNKVEYQMTKIQNMFRTLENLNFVIVSDFEFRASNFRTLCDPVDYAGYNSY